jgi:hypothetical protein
MRRLITDFYADLYGGSNTDPQCAQQILQGMPKLGPEQILQGMPKLGPEQIAGLEGDFSSQELTAAVQQLSPGRAPGVDGLTAEFYKCFCGVLGRDLLDVFRESFERSVLPVSCQRAGLSLLLKKGDLALLSNEASIVALLGLQNTVEVFGKSAERLFGQNSSQDQASSGQLVSLRDVIDITRMYDQDLSRPVPVRTGIRQVRQEPENHCCIN